MTSAEFHALPFERKLAAVFEQGVFLARRNGQCNDVNLYLLPDNLFVELYYDPAANVITQVRTISSTSPLMDYAAYIRLPDL